MIIAREDVERMKDLARRVSGEQNPLVIHQLEHGFKEYMTAKYGEKEAIRLLTKVWKMSSKLKAIPETEESQWTM